MIFTKMILSVILLLSTTSVFAVTKARTIQHTTCDLNVLRLENFRLSPTIEKTLLLKGYAFIEVEESDYAINAKVDDLVLGFNSKNKSKNNRLFYDLSFQSSITLKKVISTEGGPKYRILDTRETASSKTITGSERKKLPEAAREDVGSFLTEHCMPLLEQAVQDLPSCAIR